jgi:hypothetical protein
VFIPIVLLYCFYLLAGSEAYGIIGVGLGLVGLTILKVIIE